MPSLLDSALGWMQDPRRTQQLQGTGRAIQQGLLNIQQSDKRFQDLFDKSFGDPKQPFKVTDKKALSELTQMTQSGLLGMAEIGMLSKAVKGLSTGASIKSLDEISAKYPDVVIDASVGKKDINLSRIVVPKEMRNQGVGTQVMSDLSEYADSIGKRITLTPSSDFGGSVPKLKAFYKELGFVENKGKNKDFSTRETMYREPKESVSLSYPQQEALDTAQRNAVEYPLAPAGTRYEEFGGQLTYMTPDEYLSRVRPLELDDVSLENIAALKSHVQSGGQLDPLHIYKSGVEDGRHRAYMAKELGIEKIPVALHTEANNLGQNIPLDALSLLAEQQRKQITGLLE